LTEALPLTNAPLEKPRWPGGPKICPVVNLPAFVDSKALDEFLKTNAPSCKVVHKGQCKHCGHWHAKTVAPDPAGASSGNGRSTSFATLNKITHLSEIDALLEKEKREKANENDQR
jgi:hypothetical protein